MTMQVFPTGHKTDFIKPKSQIGQVFHSSPARSNFSFLGNSGFECLSNTTNSSTTSDNPVTKPSRVPKQLNVKGNGLPSSSEKSSGSVEDEHDSYYERLGFLKKTSGKQTKNRNNLLPQLCYELKERQRCENLSDVCLSSSPTLPAFSSSVIYKKITATKQNRSLREVRDICHSRGIMVHTGRYQWPHKKSELFSESLDRGNFSSLQDNLHPLHHKQITIPPVRANTLHVVLGGKKIEMEERFSLMREIQRLKCVVLPDHARHLFHGKGFKLPMNHGSIKPRGVSLPDDDKYDMEPVLRHLKCRQSADVNSQKNRNPLPFLKKSSTFTEVNNDGANSDGVADTTNESRDEPTAGAEGFDRLQSEEVEEEGTSQIPAAVEGNTEDAENIGSNKNQDNYQSHLTENNLKPLTATLLENVPSSEEDVLKETFNKLDSDQDGHLLYSQLKSFLPAKFSINQEKFIKEVYNITSESTFFGISEFWGMTQLTKSIEPLSGPALEAYNLLKFDTLQDSITEYLTDFQSADPSSRGSLSLDALCSLLSKHTKQNFLNDRTSWNKVLSNIALTDPDSIRKTNFLAHIPYFLSLE